MIDILVLSIMAMLPWGTIADYRSSYISLGPNRFNCTLGGNTQSWNKYCYFLAWTCMNLDGKLASISSPKFVWSISEGVISYARRLSIIHVELKVKYQSDGFTKTKDSRIGSLCWLIEYLIMRIMFHWVSFNGN